MQQYPSFFYFFLAAMSAQLVGLVVSPVVRVKEEAVCESPAAVEILAEPFTAAAEDDDKGDNDSTVGVGVAPPPGVGVAPPPGVGVAPPPDVVEDGKEEEEEEEVVVVVSCAVAVVVACGDATATATATGAVAAGESARPDE